MTGDELDLIRFLLILVIVGCAVVIAGSIDPEGK
jgi:hypothetical protein